MKRTSTMTWTLIAGLCLAVLFYFFSDVFGPSRDALYKQANEAYAEDNYPQARAFAEQALEARSGKVTKAELLNLIGSSYDAESHFEDAIHYYRLSLDEDDSKANVWTNLGISYRLLSDYDKAAEAYQQALNIDPDYAEAHSSLGTLLLIKGDAQASLEHFEKALALLPDLAVTHGNYALALGMVGRFDEANDELKRSVMLGYGNADVIRERIEELKARHEHEAAEVDSAAE